MAFAAQTFLVLIASPGDLPEERQVAVDAINMWNAEHSSADHVVLLPVMWETHAVPEMGALGPQEIINRQLVDQCDLLIGMFWTRLGTATGVAESGTVEEIGRVVAAGKPAMLYFSQRAIDPTKIDFSQHQRLMQFAEVTRQSALVQNFVSLEQLRMLLDRHLSAQVRRLKAAAPAPPAGPGPMRPAANSFDVVVRLPPPNTAVTSPVVVSGTLSRSLPPEYELWLFTQGHWSGDDAWWPQTRINEGPNWSASYVARDPKPGDRRTLRIFVVGPDGRALIATWRRINSHFTQQTNQHWVGMSRLTADVIAATWYLREPPSRIGNFPSWSPKPLTIPL
jgi:hypothetical protein